MNLEELSKMSEAELREKANTHLAPPSFATPSGGEVFLKPNLSDAQFFIDEIERRKQSRTAQRDLILEIVVIVLIGLELIVGLLGGSQQLAVLQKLNVSAGQQLGVLQTMTTTANETAKTMKSMREEEDKALTTQEQTLQIIVQMNDALQAQLGLNFSPYLTMVYDESNQSFDFQNFGKTNLFIWGSKFGKEDRQTSHEPRIIPPSPALGYTLPVDTFLKLELAKLPKGGTETLSYEIYLKTADGKKYTAHYFILPTWKDDKLTFHVQHIGIKRDNW